MSIWIDARGRRHVGVMVNGQRVHRVLPPEASARDAKQLEAELRAALGRRDPTIPGDPPMVAIMQLYMEHARSLRSPDTAIHHATRAGPWCEGRTASEARHVAAQIVTDMRGSYATATINRTLGAISKGLRLAWELGHTPEDYSRHIRRLPEHNMRDVTLTLDQVQALASHASDEDMGRIIARARATAQIASAVVATVKVECEALRTAHALELLPVGSAVPAQMRQLLGSDE